MNLGRQRDGCQLGKDGKAARRRRMIVVMTMVVIVAVIMSVIVSVIVPVIVPVIVMSVDMRMVVLM
jgi:hypothetical protein